VIDIENISIKHGTATVLSDVSLSLTAGKTVVLIGPNGAGKTSLIRAMNGTIPIDSGRVLLDGRPIKEYSRKEIARRIAVVAQENETKFPVAVMDFVLAGRFARGGAFGWETDNDRAVATEALKECGLEGFSDRLMNELSGGERQRVLFARAIAVGSDVLLLDEPTANLDLAHQSMIFRLVRERCQTAAAGAVVITHDLNLAAEFGDTVVMLDRGRVHAAGRPEEVLTLSNINEVFGIDSLLDRHPVSGRIRVTAVYDRP
jgi:iron complex transport system ATP-binding protein